MSPSISYSGRRTSRDSATSSSRGSQPARSWMAFSAGIRLGPGNLPARASTPGTRAWASAIGAADLDGTELELGDLPERGAPVDGQQVRRRLPEVERDEAVAARLPVGDLHLELDRTAAGAHPGHVAIGQAPLGGVTGMDEHQR